MTKTVTIIIPSYNGKSLLRRNLPALLENAKECEIIVVDNGSTDGTECFMKETYPSVRVLPLDKNHGFSFAVNAGVRIAKGEIIYLLNSDVEVLEGFLEPLVSHFDSDDVFAVGSSQAVSGAQVIPLVKFRLGIFWYWHEKIPARPCEVFTVSGGQGAFHREKFMSLGSFDTMFNPMYGEDGDICWRAWKRGWRSIIEPKSMVRHEGQGTANRVYSKRKILSFHWKNRFLFTWKSITNIRLLFEHLFFLIPEAVILPFMGKPEFTAGLMGALRQLPELIKNKRSAARPGRERYTDLELLRRFSRAPRFPPFNVLYLHETSCFSGAEESLLNLAENIDRKIYKARFVLPDNGIFTQTLKNINVDTSLVRMPRPSRARGVVRAVGLLRKIVKDKKIDLIHANSIRTNIYGSIVGGLEKVPVIWHQRNLITGEIIDPDRLLAFLPDSIICNSMAIADRFKSRGRLPSKVKVIYNGVNLKRFNPDIDCESVKKELGLKEDTAIIGMASRFAEDKGHDYFLKEARLIKDAFRINAGAFLKKDVKFLIIGGAVFKKDAHRERYLKDLARELGLRDSVIFCGFRNNMPQFFSALDVFVLMSRAEACGRVLIEAMASGRPIVSSDRGGSPELVPDGEVGILISPSKTGEMSDAVLTMLKDERRMRRMGASGRQWAEKNFSIEKNADLIQKVYRKLLEPINYQGFN